MFSIEGLTSADADGRAEPRLAERWDWDLDYRRLRLRLRPNVFFHDGTPLSSGVVADILRKTIARPSTQAAYPSLVDVVAVQTEGDLGVTLDLARPSAFLPEDLTLPLAIGRGVGTGPYKLVSQSTSELSFERFDRYHRGVPSIERIQVRTFDTLRTAWSGLLRGDVDMVTDVPADALEFLRTDDVDLLTYERWYQFMVAFNSSRDPFRSPDVRRALNMAVNREAVIERVLKGFGSPSTGPIWPKHWAYDSSVPPYPFDIRMAAQLLDRAGLRPGAVSDSAGPPARRLRFTCLVPGDFSLLERIALELQKQLYDVGIDMQFEVVPLEEYVQRLETGNFEAVLVDMISGPTLSRLYIFWRSAKPFKGLNVFGYENAEAERLFNVLRTSMNEAAIRSATARLQRVFHDDPPALFLAWNERTRAVRSDFGVVQEGARDPMLTIWHWEPSGEDRSASR